MDYNHIKDYLDKFKNLLFLKEENNRIIASIIKKDTQIEIEEKFIRISGDKIQIKASPLIKNEILMNKEKILKDLSDILKSQSFKDIR